VNDELGNRRLYVPRGRDPVEDLNILADCIAASDADLFEQNGAVVLLDRGVPVRVNPATLRETIMKHVVTKGLVSRADKWQVEYSPCQPDEMTLRALLTAKTLEEGGLVQRLPKGPSEPHKLTPQQQQEVQVRLKTGESYDSIARSYGVDVATIRQLGQINR
jgi:hypothetical protein